MEATIPKPQKKLNVFKPLFFGHTAEPNANSACMSKPPKRVNENCTAAEVSKNLISSALSSGVIAELYRYKSVLIYFMSQPKERR